MLEDIINCKPPTASYDNLYQYNKYRYHKRDLVKTPSLIQVGGWLPNGLYWKEPVSYSLNLS